MHQAAVRSREILVCGNPTIDEFVQKEKHTSVPGGAVLYAGCAAASLGSNVRILGNVGPDYPSSMLQWFRSRNVNISAIRKTPDPTTRFRIEYRNERRKLWVLAAGSRIRLIPKILSDTVHLGTVFGEIDPSTVTRIRAKCNFLSADLQGFVRASADDKAVKNVRRRLGILFGSCDMVKASLSEVENQFAISDPEDAVDTLLRQGPSFVIVTLGSKGSILGSSDRSKFLIPAFPDRETVDPTGAGDVLIGSWLSIFSSIRDPVWAASVGSAFASITSRKRGLSKFLFSRRELFRRSSWIYQRVKAVE